MSQIAADPDLWEQLVDVEDPVLPDVIEPLRKMNEEEARESDAQLSVVATVLAVLSALALTQKLIPHFGGMDCVVPLR